MKDGFTMLVALDFAQKVAVPNREIGRAFELALRTPVPGPLHPRHRMELWIRPRTLPLTRGVHDDLWRLLGDDVLTPQCFAKQDCRTDAHYTLLSRTVG